jgi:carbon monoxide dehydrogenase subunit G
LDLSDEVTIKASRETVFAALNDVEILRQAIPGCEEIESQSATEFSATVSAKVGPLKARFKGQATLSDVVPPCSYTVNGEGRGGPAGHAKMRASVELEESGAETILKYQVHADIGGKLAQLGGHLVQGTAKKLAAQFFENLEGLVNAGPASSETENDDAQTVEPASTGGNAAWTWLALGSMTLVVIAWLARG